jgi:hypothetical protein
MQSWQPCPVKIKKNIAAKSKEVKTGCSLAQFCKEGCGSKRAVLAMMKIMIYYNLIYP